MQIKVAKFEGAFSWHHHEAEDEAFLVVSGRVRIGLGDGAVDLGPGELVVVPRSVEHRPVAVEAAQVVLFEQTPTVNIGSAEGDARTVTSLQRLDGR